MIVSSKRRLGILVPSRGRPHSVMRLFDQVQDTAEHPGSITLWVRLDDDDPSDYSNMADLPEDASGVKVRAVRGPRVRLAVSWNELAGQAVKDGATHLALWGDDNIPVTQKWDTTLIDRLDREGGHGFVYGRDGVWDHTLGEHAEGHLVLPTAVVLDVESYLAMGYVAPPGMVHLCIDVAWRDLGLAAGCLFYERDVLIRHLHRVAGAPDDQTYRDANDNPAQVRQDNIALSRWKVSNEFRRARDALTGLRNGEARGEREGADLFGRVAYAAYVRSCGGVSKFTGDALPGWADQDPEIRGHWVAAASAVLAAYLGPDPR